MDFRTLLDSSFLLAETVTDMSGNQFLKKDLILDILASGNHIFFKSSLSRLVETYFSV